MSDDAITHTFRVRGRPVGFVPGHFGGALVAVERGYFPISSTGYRSLAGHFGISGEADPAAVSAEFLEALATAQDRHRRTLLAQLRRTPVATSDRLGNFIGVSIEAEAALGEGFFAPEAERFGLWAGAFRRLSLIDSDPRFQPVPTATVWTVAGCAEALAARRAALEFVRRLATGELPSPPDGTHFAVPSYYELPPKAAGEPAFVLPTAARELALDVLPTVRLDDATDEEEVEGEPAPPPEPDPAQLSLF